MDEEGHAVEAAQELVDMYDEHQGLYGICQMLLESLHRGCFTAMQIQEYIESPAGANSPMVVWTNEFVAMMRDFARRPASTKLSDCPEFKPLYDVLYEHGYMLPTSNYVEEIDMKVLKRELHSSHRKSEETATIYFAGRTRDFDRLFPMSDEDLIGAAAQQGRNKSDWGAQRIDDSDLPDLPDVKPVSMEYEREEDHEGHDPEEEEAEEEEEIEAITVDMVDSLLVKDLKRHLQEYGEKVGGNKPELTARLKAAIAASEDEDDDDMGDLDHIDHAEKVLDSLKKREAKFVRPLLSDQLIVGVQWDVNPDGSPDIYLAQIQQANISARASKVKIRWLHQEVEGGSDYIYDPNFPKIVPWLISEIFPSLRIKKISQPGEAPRWRWLAEKADKEAADKMQEASAQKGSQAAATQMGEQTGMQTGAQAMGMQGAQAMGAQTSAQATKQASKQVKAPIPKQARSASGEAQQYSDGAILSDRPQEHLNDMQMLNLFALKRPVQSLTLADSGIAGYLIASSISGRTCRVRSIISAPESTESHALCFCESRHWWFVGACGPDRTVYCWEPFGSDYTCNDLTPAGAKLRRAFDEVRADGWNIVAVPWTYQSDGYQCGVWCQKVTDALLDYVEGGCCAGNAGANFVSYLRAWMERQQPAVRPLDDAMSGMAYRTAKGQNQQYIRVQRNELRELLVCAARAGQLQIMASTLPDFDGLTLAHAIDCEEDDASRLRGRVEEALGALLSADAAEDRIAIHDLFEHMGLTASDEKAQVEGILLQDIASSSPLVYRQGYIHCGCNDQHRDELEALLAGASARRAEQEAAANAPPRDSLALLTEGSAEAAQYAQDLETMERPMGFTTHTDWWTRMQARWQRMDVFERDSQNAELVRRIRLVLKGEPEVRSVVIQ